jgi:hypothetical protein
MRKWRNLGPPDDPESWYDVDGFWPTVRGTYETCTLLTAGANTGQVNGAAAPLAFRGGGREYLAAGVKTWEYSAGVFTDRTGGVDVPTNMVQYGSVTIGSNGSAGTMVYSTGGNFALLAAGPGAYHLVTCSNAVLALNVGAGDNAWKASDVGDYTNWTTGEAASGLLIQTPGAILAACAFNDAVYVFKTNSIYRGRYVGGAVKWAWEVVSDNLGMAPMATNSSRAPFSVCAGIDRMMFIGASDSAHFAAGAGKSGRAVPSFYAYLFDGVSPPRMCNPETSISFPNASPFTTVPPYVTFDPISNMFCVSVNNQAYFYNVASDAWGYKSSLMSGLSLDVITNGNQPVSRPILGDYSAAGSRVPSPEFYGVTAYSGAAGLPATSTRFALDTTLANIGNHYLQTNMMGKDDRKTFFDRVIPRLRRRNGSGTAALSVTAYRELENSTAESTTAVTENTSRQRFDFGVTDNFIRAKVTYNALDVEAEDFKVRGKDAGEN